MVSNNMIQKFPVYASDINNIYIMFGTNIDGTKVNPLQHDLGRLSMD